LGRLPVQRQKTAVEPLTNTRDRGYWIVIKRSGAPVSTTAAYGEGSPGKAALLSRVETAQVAAGHPGDQGALNVYREARGDAVTRRAAPSATEEAMPDTFFVSSCGAATHWKMPTPTIVKNRAAAQNLANSRFGRAETDTALLKAPLPAALQHI